MQTVTANGCISARYIIELCVSCDQKDFSDES